MKRTLAFLCVGLLLIGVRLFVAASSYDSYERGEEYVRASAALGVSSGLERDLNQALRDHELPEEGLEMLFFHPYEGGGFTQALVSIPVFKLVGPTRLAHKLVAIAFDLAILFAGMWLTREAFETRAQWSFGLLWIFGPLAFQKLALLNLGIHYQALLFQFSLAALVLTSMKGRARPLALGLIGGFGLFYNYQIVPLIGLSALALLATRRLDRRQWIRLSLGFAIGAIPLWLMLLRTGSAMFNIHGQTLGETDTNSNGLVDLAKNLGAALGPRGAIQLIALAGLAAFGAIRGTRASRLLGIYVAVFCLIIPLTGFMTVNFRDAFGAMRYAPLFGMAVVLTAGGLTRLPTKAGQLGLAALVLLGLSSTAATRNNGLGWQAGLANITHIAGLDDSGYFTKICSRLNPELLADKPAVLKALTAQEPSPQGETFEAAVEALTAHDKARLEEFLPALLEARPQHTTECLMGLGAWAIRGQRGQLFLAQRRLRQQMLGLPAGSFGDLSQKSAIEAALEGLGHYGTGAYPSDDILRDELNQMAHSPMQLAVYRGFGRRVFHAFGLAPGKLEPLLQGRRAEVQTQIRAGFEAQRQRLWLD